MAAGVFGYKGRVHLHICKPINKECEDTEELADLIQEEIISNYYLWPSNYTAVSMLPESDANYLDTKLSGENQNSLSFFKDRLKDLNSQQREELLMTYARPFFNKERARLSSGS